MCPHFPKTTKNIQTDSTTNKYIVLYIMQILLIFNFI